MPILLKGDEVLLKGLLAQNASDMLQKLSTTDRGEGVPIFRWDDNHRFGGDDFDDPTTNVHDIAP